MTYKNSFLQNRILKLQVCEKGTALVIEDPIDLYYLTGLHFSAGQLWISLEEVLLLVDGRYIEAAKEAPCHSALASSEEIKKFTERNGIRTIRFDGGKTMFVKAELLQKTLPEISFVSSPFLTKDLRIIKDPSEIKALQKSADLLTEGFSEIKTLMREGVSERDLSKAFTLFCLERDADSLSFEPIIAFGENSAKPHYRAGTRRLKQGDSVLIDIGVCKAGYHSDMTRTFFFGEGDPFLVNWGKIVKEAYEAAAEKCKAGLQCKELDVAARAVFKKYGVEEYFVHSLGHGVGLEVHEFPRVRFDSKESEISLESGMVLTIEPGLYFPGKGGVRYENTVLVGEGPLSSFTQDS